MRDTNARRWKQWRVTQVASSPSTTASERFERPALPVVTDEQPGPDGIRHELVARIRREIEAGTYDTEERWLAAEEKLLARIG